MAIDQPTATIIAAGIMAVGAISVALINKKASDKPIRPKAITTPLFLALRSVWPSVIIVVFSIFMVVRSLIVIGHYSSSQAPATEAMVISAQRYYFSLLIFSALIGWMGSGIMRAIQKHYGQKRHADDVANE